MHTALAHNVHKARAMYSGNTLWAPNRVGLVWVIAIGASFVAAAAEPAPVATASTAAAEPATPPRPAFRGSALTYGHLATAYTFDRAAEPHYNPTWSHHLGIAPEWHFNDQLFVRGALSLSQEFTASDSTSRLNEVELSDLALAVGVTGFKEKVTGLKLGGSLQVAFPTSKASHAQTRLLALGPSLTLSRTFALRSGLTLAYSGRYSYRFHKFTTAQRDAPAIVGCGDPGAAECADFIGFGRRNAHSDLTHGPTVTFAPIDAVTVAASYAMTTQWLYPVAKSDAVTDATPFVSNRYYTDFDLSVSWQIFRPVGIALGASTSSPQLNTFGTRYFPLFNRNTVLYLDIALDVEAAVTGIFGDRS